MNPDLNPNKKIDAKKRSKLALASPHDDDYRTLSRWEREELRARLIGVQCMGNGDEKIRAMRIVTLIDESEDAQELRARVAKVVHDAADLSESVSACVDAVTEALDLSIKSKWGENFDDLLTDNATATREEIAAMIARRLEAAIDEAKEEALKAVGELRNDCDTMRELLGSLNDGD